LEGIVQVEQSAGSWTREQISKELSNPIASVLVACIAAGSSDHHVKVEYVCGWLTAWCVPPYELQILQLTVTQQNQQCGVGTQLLAEILKRKGYASQETFLEVRESNLPAIALYKKFEFDVHGARKRYYQDGESALIMKRDNTSHHEER